MKKSTGLALTTLTVLASLSGARAGIQTDGSNGYIVISDIDDTVKITHVLKTFDALDNGLITEKAFTGMGPLYTAFFNHNQGLTQPASPLASVMYLSGGDQNLRHHVNEMLVENGLPLGPLAMMTDGEFIKYLEKKLTTDAYKTAYLEQYVKVANLPFVLLGDDTQQDPQTLTTFQSNHPQNTASVYIHRLTDTNIQPGAIRYITPFEVAYAEYLGGRITAEDVVAVANSILQSGKPFEDLIPTWSAVCPTDGDLLGGAQITKRSILPESPGDYAIDEVEGQVNQYVQTNCQARANPPSDNTDDSIQD